jgi:hypothetical protein
MRRFIVLLIFGFIFMIFAGEIPVLDSKACASPSISVPEPRYEFAPVVDGKEFTHDFVIQNKGDAPLIIERVKTD